jgi:hypothetical protein
MAKSIHTVGFKAPIYDKSIIDSIAQTKDWTFKDRIGWICAVLKNSKNVGVTLMVRFLLHPVSARAFV